MRHLALVLGVALLLGESTTAQDTSRLERNPDDRSGQRPDEGGRRRGPGERRPPPNLLFEAIDANGDQVITPREMRKALDALKRLDSDQDGNLSLDEVTPRRPDGPGERGQRDPSQFIDRMLENDTNGDGKLQPEEVPERMMRMLAGGDTNQDGAIDAEELALIMENRPGGRRGGPPGGDRDPQQLVEQLMSNDKNGDGMLSPEEVPEQAMRMLRGADLNKDGYLNAKEVAKVAERMSRRGGRRSARGPGRGPAGERGGDRPQRPPSE